MKEDLENLDLNDEEKIKDKSTDEVDEDEEILEPEEDVDDLDVDEMEEESEVF